MCGCSGQVGNCNCNDCSLITVPSIVGPAGPAGNNGINGVSVLDVQSNIITGASTPGFRTYNSPVYQINLTNYFNSERDALRIKGNFRYSTPFGATGYFAGVAINSNSTADSSHTPLFQYGNSSFLVSGTKTECFYFELELSRTNIINQFTVTGFIMNYNDQFVTWATNISVPVDQVRIIRNTSFSSTHLSSNFYIYFYTSDVSGISTVLDSMSIEHKKGV